MKITIELHIQPDEVTLAAELLSTLRSLTDHVKVVTPAGGTAAAAPVGPAIVSAGGAAVPPPAPSSAQPAPSSLPNGGPASYPAAPAPAQQAPSPVPPVPAAPAAPAAAPAAPAAASPAPAAAAPAAPAAAAKGVPQPFPTSVRRLAIPSEQVQAAADITATLLAAGENLDAALEDLINTYEQCVFNDQASLSTGAMPYMTLYQLLPENMQLKFRDRLMQKILGVLARKRPVDTDRTAFFTYADAFAALVKLEAVAMDGALQTLARLLGKPDTRAASVTMLGKTIEYCGEQVLRCNQTVLGSLFRSLETVKEECFAYDMHYISHSLSAGMAPAAAPAGAAAAPAAAPAAAAALPTPPAAAAAPTAPAAAAAPAPAPAAPPAPPPALASAAHVGGYVGHSAAVFSLCWDVSHNQLASGGQDGQLLIWGPDGNPSGRIEIPDLYVCALDVLPRSGTLVAAGVPVDPSKPDARASILAFNPPPGAAPGQPRVGPWAPRGRISLPAEGYVSIVRALPGDGDVFVTGETRGEDVVCLYDITQSPSIDRVGPLSVYRQHTDLVTCAAACYSLPSVFVTGSRDKSILVWDRRVAQSVGAFGDIDGGAGKILAHNEMITWLDCGDNLLMSSCVDGSVGVWDFRMLTMTPGSHTGSVGRFQMGQQPVLKVALMGAPHSRLAAVSTYQGLYVMDFTDMAAPVTVVAAAPAGPAAKAYHDIRWAGGPGAPGQPLLFGASEDPRIDIFAVAFA